MKLTAILILATCLQVSASGFSQNVTLSKSNISLKSVIMEIERQSGYQFFYKEKLLQQAGNVSIHVSNISVEEALNTCFKNQPLTYSIVDKVIVIKEKKQFAVKKEPVIVQQPQAIIVKGVVADSIGRPLEGAFVRIKGANRGVATDLPVLGN